MKFYLSSSPLLLLRPSAHLAAATRKEGRGCYKLVELHRMREILFPSLPPSAMPVCSRVFFDAAKECGLVCVAMGGGRIRECLIWVLGVGCPRFLFSLDSINFAPTSFSFEELENSFDARRGKSFRRILDINKWSIPRLHTEPWIESGRTDTLSMFLSLSPANIRQRNFFLVRSGI